MYFASLQELIAMNGHGPYVWGAYGIGFVVIAALVYWPIQRHRTQQRLLHSSFTPKGEPR
jgi:heme exporter protein D